MTKAYSSQKEIRAIIGSACDAKELLILVTQYLKFESSFVLLDGGEIHAKATADGAEALKTLGVSDLDLRFPSGRDFLGASTRLLGPGSAEGARTIRLAMPTQLRLDDDRKAPRTHLTEGAFAAFGLRGRPEVRAAVSNISVSGVRLTLDEGVPVSELRVRDRLALTVSLPGGVAISGSAVVRHADRRNFGMEFDPRLSGRDMAVLSTWVFRRKEEELERAAASGDAEARAKAAAAAGTEGAGGPGAAAGGILVATDDGGMRLALAGLLGEDRRLLTAPASPAAFRHALFQRPLMVVLHASGPAEGALVKELASDVPDGIPVMLLGTGVDADRLAEMGRECGAVASMLMAPSKGPFLQRLVLGILRKHHGGGESPMSV